MARMGEWYQTDGVIVHPTGLARCGDVGASAIRSGAGAGLSHFTSADTPGPRTALSGFPGGVGGRARKVTVPTSGARRRTREPKNVRSGGPVGQASRLSGTC